MGGKNIGRRKVGHLAIRPVGWNGASHDVLPPDGMQALYKVNSCSMTPPMNQLTGKVRQYFIEAHEILWDYGPMGHDGSTGKNLREPGR